MASLKTVVIIGGGYGGVSAIIEFNKKKIRNLNIVLITKSDFFYHNLAAPRALVDNKIIPQALISYDNVMKGDNKRFIHGEVTKIGLNEIKYLPLAHGVEKKEESLAFDYLIVALGTTYPGVFHSNAYHTADQSNLLHSVNEKTKQATKVLIVGGGPVGIETAGEIATDYPHIKVTLITNSNRLVPYMSNSVAEKSLAVLRQKKVEVIFNDTIELKNVENFKLQKLVTKNGREIEFDAYFMCIGGKPCTEIIKSSSFPNWLDEKGFIKVNKNLQVLNTNNIFSIGDCCDTKEPKLAYTASLNAGLVANNIELLLKNSVKLKEYSTLSQSMALLSVGRDNGVFQFNCITTSGFFPKKIKSEALLLPRTRKMLGYN